MENLSEEFSNLFLPVINILQEKSLDKKLNFEIDLQNNELYTLQEFTRCAALINYINFCGNRTTPINPKSKLNYVFSTFIEISDPLGVFMDNFEQFFGMYIHSKYGKNNFQLYMKECEKSPVSYPISVFEDGLCIFMQYNKTELRNYIYSIMTMFYYYTGDNFYEMICPKPENNPRPNVYDEYEDYEMKNVDNKKLKPESREEKLCFLNRRNYNIKRPYIYNQIQTQYDSLPMSSNFEKCILLNNIKKNRQLSDIIISKPILHTDFAKKLDTNFISNKTCKNNGMDPLNKIFQFSNHLNRSLNFELNTLSSRNDGNYNRQSLIQTNFSEIWISNNRRQLVSLNIIYSIMNVCVQKITQSIIETRNKKLSSSLNKRKKINRCVQTNPNFIEQNSDDDDDDDDNNYNDDGGDFNNEKIFKSKEFIKLKKPTIEVSFKNSSLNKTQQKYNNPCGSGNNNLQFSV